MHRKNTPNDTQINAGDQKVTDFYGAVRNEGRDMHACAADRQYARLIGYNYAIAHNGTNRSVGFKDDSLRYKKFDEFDKIRKSFDIEHYNSSEQCTGTGICSLIAARLNGVEHSHDKHMLEIRKAKNTEYKIAMKVARDNRCKKYTDMRNRYGDEGFNKIKKRDQAVSRDRKAETVSGNTALIAKFLEWRGSKDGREIEQPMIPMNFDQVPTIIGACSNTNLGGADATVMAEMVIYAIKNGASNMDIEFNVDKYDSDTTLRQFAITSNRSAHPVTGTTHFDETQTFKITGFIEIRDNFYVSLRDSYADKTADLYALLPTKWSYFENWTGHGIVGNPKKEVTFNLAFEISPTNIGQIKFTLDGVRYTLRFSKARTQSFDVIRKKMVGKYERAAADAKRIADDAKRIADNNYAMRAAKARREGIENAGGGGGRSNVGIIVELTKSYTTRQIGTNAYKIALNALRGGGGSNAKTIVDITNSFLARQISATAFNTTMIALK